MPDALSDELVAPVNCALSQVIFGLHRAGLRFGGSVVIQGAGGLGVQAAAVAKDMGAATVIVVDQIPGRLALAQRVRRGSHDRSPGDSGPEGAREAGAQADRRRGRGRRLRLRRLSAGHPRRHRDASQPAEPISRSARSAAGPRSSSSRAQLVWGAKRSSASSSTIPGDSASARLPRAQPRRWPFDKLVSHKYPLDEIDHAFADSEWHGRDTTTITRAALAP